MLKVATHNLEFLFDEGTHTHSGKEWTYPEEFVTSRVEHFSKLISDIDADIMFVQELASERVLVRILEKVNKGYSYFIATPDANGVGNAVLYKAKECKCESIPAKTGLPVFVEGDQDTIGPRIWSRRDFIKITTIYNGKPLYLISGHIKARFAMPKKNQDGLISQNTPLDFTDGLIRSEFFRFSQVRKMRELADDIFTADSEASVIVAGDLNCSEGEMIFKMLSGNPASQDYLGDAIQTLPEQDRFSVINSGRKRLLDHVLISKALESEVASVIVLNNDLPDTKDNSGTLSLIGSDHAPVVLSLK